MAMMASIMYTVMYTVTMMASIMYTVTMIAPIRLATATQGRHPAERSA